MLDLLLVLLYDTGRINCAPVILTMIVITCSPNYSIKFRHIWSRRTKVIVVVKIVLLFLYISWRNVQIIGW